MCLPGACFSGSLMCGTPHYYYVGDQACRSSQTYYRCMCFDGSCTGPSTRPLACR
jgi:hypothetical protein